MKAVILAGGEGRRLLPYTTTFPKPMMPVGQMPILEIIIRQLRAHGIRELVVATGYLEELIRAYFGDGGQLDVSIHYSKETRLLGTAGPLDLIRDRLRDTFLLINGDVLTDLEFGRLESEHRRRRNDLTIAVTPRTETVDFGIVHLDEHGDFASWEEKPTIEYLVSMGVYLMEPRVLERLPAGEFMNLPDFIESLKGTDLRVGGFVHEGYWLDIGRPSDYERACRDITEIKLW